MNLPKPVTFLWRVCLAGFVLLTVSYCLLAFIPFTYQQMVVAAPLAWLTAFVKFHPYLYWIVLGIQAAMMMAEFRRSNTKILAFVFVAYGAVLGIVLLIHPALAGLGNDISSLYWASAFFALLLLLAALDWVSERERLQWDVNAGGEEARIFQAAWQTALFLALLYSAIYYRAFSVLTFAWSVLSHLFAFLAIGIALFAMRAAAARFPQPAKWEFFSCSLGAGLAAAGALRFIVFSSIPFTGASADLYALASGICFAAFFAGTSLRLYGPSSVDSGLALLLTPLRLPSFFYLPGIALLAYLLASQSALLDWNFLRQRVSALLIWVIAFATFYELAPRKELLSRRMLWLITPVASVCLYLTLAFGLTRVQVPPQSVIGSFKVTSSGRASFYSFIVANTNITAAAGPVDVNFVDNLSEGNSAKPNIFVVVIDSLRRDYLSTYNPSVTFTPQIDAFGKESIVMQNAFTRYAGTGLAEPSIWVGGMMLHKQYVTPFHPMNALQKLVEAEGYTSFIGQDPILQAIMRPSDAVVDLETDIAGRRWDFCKTVEDLGDKIRTAKGGAPIFAYAQPQNIHDFEISQEGESVPPGESYPGFYEPVAARLRQMDKCWGSFIGNLKKSGLYDKSIVILTADHGDLLGERGRFGHGWVLNQEVMRIPLIIHLPPAMKSRVAFDAGAVAFSSDITPSLYYLLGHKPTLKNEFFGRPLFTETIEEQKPDMRDSYLLASSYGPVYGLLKESGHSLYIVDASDQVDYLYEIPAEGAAILKPISPSLQAENEKLIREGILAINRFYRFEQPQK